MNPRSILCVFLAAALGLPAPGWGQQVSGPKSNLAQPASGGLKVTAVQGEGAANNIRTKSATAPVVEVRDDAGKPVVGAEVVFQLPAAGPGGVFNGWMRNQTARTDDEGKARADGFTPNDEEGRFNIKVTATSGNKTGSLVIGQSNTRSGGTAAAKSSSKTMWVVLGVLAVGGIAGGVAATRGGNSTPAATVTPVTVTPGAITVGGPR